MHLEEIVFKDIKKIMLKKGKKNKKFKKSHPNLKDI
jgi:hypothetical protein